MDRPAAAVIGFAFFGSIFSTYTYYYTYSNEANCFVCVDFLTSFFSSSCFFTVVCCESCFIIFASTTCVQSRKRTQKDFPQLAIYVFPDRTTHSGYHCRHITHICPLLAIKHSWLFGLLFISTLHYKIQCLTGE